LGSRETATIASAQLFRRACHFLDARELERALRLFNAAEQTGYDADECGGGRWFCHMLGGDFESAWQESDRIARRGALDPNRLWRGCSLAGKRVVVRCLHGLGDAIQFIRFAYPLSTQTARLYVEVPGCLVTLFETIPVIDKVFSWERPGHEPRDWEEQIEVMELPRYFRTTPTNLPAGAPYLFPTCGAKLAEEEGSPVKVGIVCSSSAWNQVRSMPLRFLRPLFETPGCRFFSLQKDWVPTDDLPAELIPSPTLSASDDVRTTAGIIRKLDLVIAVDTMVAHLTGALGKPVWLLLGKQADWRWMMNRSDSPWYPTMKIFRQEYADDWCELVGRVAMELRTTALSGCSRPILDKKRDPSARDVVRI
jgi:hypothetical protein